MASAQMSSSCHIAATNHNTTNNDIQELNEICISGENGPETQSNDAQDSEEAPDGYNFSAENAIDGVDDLVRINFEVINLEDLMRFHFPNTSVAFMFYNWYASKHGFAARKSRVVKNINGDIIQQTFVCHREGHRDEQCNTTISKKRKSKPKTRCGCDAKCQVHIQSTSGRWFIKYFKDTHTHSFLDDKFKGMLPAHRKMTDYDKYQLISMRDAGIRTSQIYGYAANQVGGYDNLKYCKRDMYNEQARQKRSTFSDAKMALDFLKGLCNSDNKMFWRHTENEQGQLQNVFWCDGISRMNYTVFGDVLAFDATYRKLKYLCPLVVFSGVNHHNQSTIFAAAIVVTEDEDTYVWVLEQFLEAMEGKHPVSVITDGDPAMRCAITRVFPKAHHRLCAWHLIRRATANIKNADFVNKFKQCMLGDIEIGEFNQKWDDMVAEFGLEEDSWVLGMYEKRKMWATAYIRGNFFAGVRTTSRCEGLNSEFGKYVNVRTNLLQFLQAFFRWINYMRRREFEADFGSSSYAEHVPETQYFLLENSAAKIYTRESLKMFCTVLERACRCVVVGSKQSSTIFIYTVCKYGKPGHEKRVTFCETSLEFTCSCLRMESLGIPCEHLVSVLVFLGIVKLPDCLILKRWTKTATSAILYPTSSQRATRDPELVNTYVAIIERCKMMADAAVECGKQEYVNKTFDLIDKHTEVLKAICRGEVLPEPVDHYVQGTLKNPPKVRTKGCGGVSCSKTMFKKTPRKKPKCGACGEKGHNRKSCHVYKCLDYPNEPRVEPEITNITEGEYDDIEDNEIANIMMSLI